MSVTLIPDEIDTKIAISGAEERIAQAAGRDLFDYYGLREQQKRSAEMVAYVVLRGDSIARARSWAMHSALLRDARPTIEEARAARVAVAS